MVLNIHGMCVVLQLAPCATLPENALQDVEGQETKVSMQLFTDAPSNCTVHTPGKSPCSSNAVFSMMAMHSQVWLAVAPTTPGLKIT